MAYFNYKFELVKATQIKGFLKSCLIISFFVFIGVAGNCQEKWFLDLEAVDDADSVLSDFRNKTEFWTDTLNVVEHLEGVITEIRNEGYLLANLDSLFFKIKMQQMRWYCICCR